MTAATSEETLVILDTNVFLEFTYFVHLDWLQIMKSQKVRLLVTYPILNELDQWKRGAGRRRDRAMQVVRELRDRLHDFTIEEAEIRAGVSVALSRSGSVNAGTATSVDDHLLALAEQITALHSTTVVIVTDDSVLLAKARTRGILAMPMSEEHRLPPEPTPESRVLTRLKNEIEDLKSRAPRLSLFLRTKDGPTERGVANIHIAKALTATDLDAAVTQMKKQYENIIARLRGERASAIAGAASLLEAVGLSLMRRPLPGELARLETVVF